MSLLSHSILDTYRKIMNWRQHLIFSPELPTISKDAENLIRWFVSLSNFSYFLLSNFSLLCDPQNRLGLDVEEVKRHPFFRGTDWEHIR